MLQDSNEYYRTQSSVEDLILEHVHFTSTQTKPVQMTKLLRDLGISQPRMPDIKDASRVLAAHGLAYSEVSQQLCHLHWLGLGAVEMDVLKDQVFDARLGAIVFI